MEEALGIDMVSSYEPILLWQSSSVTGCGNREDNDVSADADPNTGAPGASAYPAQDIWTHEPIGLYAVGPGYSSVPGWGTPDDVSAFTG